MLHRLDLSRVKEVWYCAEENKPIDRADMVKGYETARGEYVVVEDEELKKIAPATASNMDVVQFVQDSEVDPIYFERSYYIGPAGDVTKPFALFMRALKESGHSAIAKVSMHGREHVVLIRATGDVPMLHTLYYPNELHSANKLSVPAKAASTRQELDLAMELIHKLAAPFHPEEFHDSYRENVEKLIEQKSKGEAITTRAKPRRAPVIDLMEALRKSLKHSAGGSTATTKHRTPASAKAAKRRKVA